MNKNHFTPEAHCHRVVNSDGEICHYDFGAPIKQKRLQKKALKLSTIKF
jgi:O6-methylguanine-DNA--protein-cysteine methyltransferase